MMKRSVPLWLITAYRRIRISRLRRANESRSVKEVFTTVYKEKWWGGRASEFCSGSGSTPSHAIAYAEMVRQFIQRHQVSSIVDLGCGDFIVGRQLLMESVKYTGIDIVDELIQHNQSSYGSETTNFLCRDIIADELPSGDLCLIRQVLQHLSNSQIEAILQRVQKYRFVMVTEHYPSPRVKSVPNVDKPHGGDTRIVDNSAVYLDQPPFRQLNLSLILEVHSAHGIVYPDEPLRTYLIDNSGASRAVSSTDPIQRRVA